MPTSSGQRLPPWAGSLVLCVTVCGCTASTDAPSMPSAPASSTLAPVDCLSSVRSGPLPPWARGGFRGDGSSFRHVEGLQGAVVGVVFGYPLTSPPRPSRANKVLWVAREPATGALQIAAQLNGSGPVVERQVGFGGGQSIVDLPSPGCWRMTLRWGDLTDVVDVPYVAPAR